MSAALYYPRERFFVRFQYTVIRPFSLIDQTILQLAQAGSSLGEAAQLLGLPPRMVVESAFELLKENMLTLTADSLALSMQGERWISNLKEYPRGQIRQGEARVFYDWNLGATNTFLRFEGEDEQESDWDGQEICRFEDLKETEDNPVEIQFGSRIYSLDQWKDTVENNLSYNIGNSQERLSIIVRSALRTALARHRYSLYEMEPLENLRSCYKYGYRIEPQAQGVPEQFREEAPDVKIPGENWLLTAEAHCQWLRQSMRDAHSHLLIFSAHQTLGALESMDADFSPTAGDSFLILGYPEKDAARYKAKTERLRHMTDEKSESDMKLAVYDDENGVVHLALGSFNWMQSYRSQGVAPARACNDAGFEVSVVLHSDRHAPALDAVLQLIITQVKGYSDSADKSKLIIALGNLRQRLEGRLKLDSGAEETAGMVVLGRAITREYGQALRHARRRCVILSHTLSESMNPLRSLNDRQTPFESSCFIAFSDMYPAHDNGPDERRNASKEEVEGYIRKNRPKNDGAVQISQLPGLHSRLIVNDDIVTVSSLNCLSARKAVDNAFGFRFRDPESARMLEEFFTKNHGSKQDDSFDGDAVAAVLQSIQEKGETLEDLARSHPEIYEALKTIARKTEKS